MFINDLFGEILSKYPITLIDIGASGGLESPWNLLDRNLEMIGFEPDIEAFTELSRKNNKIGIKKKYLNMALHKENAVIDFYITRRQGHSSIFEPNKEIIRRFSFPERYDVLEIRKIITSKLDEALKNAGILDVDFIKLDTQGSELAILEGGERTLSKCFGIEAEVEFLSLYKNQPLFSELEIFVRKFGFELFDIKRHYEKLVKYKDVNQAKGQLVCGDALFLKSYNRFIQDICTEDAERVKAKILKSISICYLYKLIDYALEITEESFNHQYLTEREKEIITRELGLGARGRNRYQMIMDWVKVLPREFLKLVSTQKPRGSYNDETLGNIRR